jgi:hypothetical protein
MAPYANLVGPKRPILHPRGWPPIPNVPHWPEADEWANMETILDLLDASEMTAGDQGRKGELLRQLGRFDEAIAVLKAVPADGHREVRAVRIEWQARQGHLSVRPLGNEEQWANRITKKIAARRRPKQ